MHVGTPEAAVVIWPGVHHLIWPPTSRVIEARWQATFPLGPIALLAFHNSFNVSLYGAAWEQSVQVRSALGWSVECTEHEHYMMVMCTQESVHHIPWSDTLGIGRGDKCPCGSDRAFRKCHGKVEDQLLTAISSLS